MKQEYRERYNSISYQNKREREREREREKEFLNIFIIFFYTRSSFSTCKKFF